MRLLSLVEAAQALERPLDYNWPKIAQKLPWPPASCSIRCRYAYPAILEVAEIAQLVCYLASDQAKSITGQAINICGGQTMV